MKRITTLVLAAAMLCGAHSVAQAAEIKVNGFWQISGVYQDSLNFLNNEAADAKGSSNINSFDVLQRIAVTMTIQNSENLKSTIAFYAPWVGEWGSGDFAAGGGDLPITLAYAYIDWFVPTTDIMVRMGLQHAQKADYLNLPTNPVFNQLAPGVAVIAPINENLTFQGQWLRLRDTNTTASAVSALTPNYTSISADYFTALLPMNYDSWSVTPWVSYLTKADDIDAVVAPAHMNGLGGQTYWIGLTSVFKMFDPFTFNIDFLYSKAKADKDVPTNVINNFDGEGWLVDGSIAYRHKWGSTKLTAWYSQGESENGENGHFGTIIPNWISGTAYYHQDLYNSPVFLPYSGATNPNGTWGLMLTHTGFELAQNWHIGGHIMYINGTNHVDNAANTPYSPAYLTTKDSLVEFSFWTRHQLMKNLTASFEFNYILQNFDEDVWFSATEQAQGAKFEDGFRTNISFFYTF